MTERMTQFLRISDDRRLLETAERLAAVGSWEWGLTADLTPCGTRSTEQPRYNEPVPRLRVA